MTAQHEPFLAPWWARWIMAAMEGGPPLDGDEFRRWREEAWQALRGRSCRPGSGFSTRALLHGLGRGPWGHDLVRLSGSCRSGLPSAWPSSSRAPRPACSPVGFTPAELEEARRRRNPLVLEAEARGLPLPVGEP